MRRHVIIVFTACLLTAAPIPVLAQTGARCDTARDLMRNALQRLQPGAGPAVLQEVSQNLRRVTDLCPGLGDAYHYLSLIAAELKDTARSETWRQRAAFYESRAQQRNDPLYGGVKTDVEEPATAPVTAAPPAPTAVSAIVKQKLALVVGVSRFRDQRINALKYTTRDAEAVAAALETEAGFDYVKLLRDEEATQVNVKTEIDRIAKMATPDDLVVLYVASHGSPDSLDTAGVNYIVTHDTDVNNLYATAVSMDDVLEAITGRIKAERLVAFLDTCYSGGTFRELPINWVKAGGSRSLARETGVAVSQLQTRLESGSRALVVETAGTASSKGRVKQGLGRVVITSSSQSQRSWEADRIGHGYFTYYLLEILRRPGLLSVDDVFAHLRLRVPDAVLKDKKESQNPGIARSRERVDIYLKDREP